MICPRTQVRQVRIPIENCLNRPGRAPATVMPETDDILNIKAKFYVDLRIQNYPEPMAMAMASSALRDNNLQHIHGTDVLVLFLWLSKEDPNWLKKEISPAQLISQSQVGSLAQAQGTYRARDVPPEPWLSHCVAV